MGQMVLLLIRWPWLGPLKMTCPQSLLVTHLLLVWLPLSFSFSLMTPSLTSSLRLLLSLSAIFLLLLTFFCSSTFFCKNPGYIKCRFRSSKANIKQYSSMTTTMCGLRVRLIVVMLNKLWVGAVKLRQQKHGYRWTKIIVSFKRPTLILVFPMKVKFITKDLLRNHRERRSL